MLQGNVKGMLLETELIRPTSFKNHYEETKFEAELLVEELKKDVAVTIIRPGIVRGHSKTGETIKFDGPYFFMNMIDELRMDANYSLRRKNRCMHKCCTD